MNKKGFTLIEVIVVIVIIVILSLILIPNVMLFINKNNINSCEKLITNIESSAKIYVSENKYDLGFDCSDSSKTITLQTLVDEGDLSSPITNPITKADIDLNKTTVTVTYNCNNKTFTYKVEGITCQETK
ncbi:MAG: prepilin-type N-terminal cleavage/methylation domain-containing protein [Bacilli bacterium]